MNIKHIKELAEILDANKLTAVEVSEGETRIRLEKNNGTVYTTTIPSDAHSLQQPSLLTDENLVSDDAAVNFNNIKEIKSPMVGIFYQNPAPDAEPYVKIGSQVKKGDVICVIEAMKVMNEITSDVDGEIVDICAKNGQIVEFSEVLFKIF